MGGQQAAGAGEAMKGTGRRSMGMYKTIFHCTPVKFLKEGIHNRILTLEAAAIRKLYSI